VLLREIVETLIIMGERKMKKLKKKETKNTVENHAGDDKMMKVQNVDADEASFQCTSDIKDESSKPKKRKIDKSKTKTDTALGVVDEGILLQAGTNLGLPLLEDSVNTEDDVKIEDVKRKKRKKEKTKMEIKRVVDDSQEEGDKTSRSLSYLRSWSSDKERWKFNKSNQIHLLNIMYNETKMFKEDFDLLLEYLVDLKGKSREKTKEDAEKVLKTSGSFFERDRARQIFQLLC